MFDVQGRARAVTLMAGLLSVAVLTGCSGSGSAARSNSPGSTAAGMAMSKGGGMFSAIQLKHALLTRINGAKSTAKPDAGSYSALPEINAAAARMTKVTITPRACVQATVLETAALDNGELGSAPAAIVNFRVGTNAVSEVLASPPNAATAASLGRPIPASCDRYSASASGKTFHYAVRQDWVQGIGRQPARVLNIAAVGKRSVSVWSLLYQGNGFVGSITVMGPNASEAAVHELGQQAYAYASRSLG